MRDSLWVRIIDVPRALTGRRYAISGTLLFELRDEFFPENSGTYKLEGGPDGAECSRSEDRAELRISVPELGAIYLGGNRLRALARAGRAEGTAEALTRADLMFSWDPVPWCPEVF